LNLTLCLHELATNAIKYGALSNGTGQVRVSWQVMDELDGRKLQLTWKETGGPPVSAPKRHGFGSLLITSTGDEKTRIDYQPDGVMCFLELSV
jgi:two-component sensor histidine kinase